MNFSVAHVRHRTRMYLDVLFATCHVLWIRWRNWFKNSKQSIIGIMLLEHLGDIVACEPVARYMRQQNPDAIIVWCVKKQYRELVEYHPDIDVVLTLHCLTVKECLKRIGIFSRVIDLHFRERYCSLCSSNMQKEIQTSPDEISLTNFYHHGNILQSFSLYAGLPKLNDAPQLFFPTNISVGLQRFALPKKYIVIHCSSNTDEKDWQTEKWQLLAQHIIEHYALAIVEVGTDAKIVMANQPLYYNLCNQLAILETAYVIQQSAMFIGIDSGPAHLANAVGTRGILLIGSFLNFNRYNPFSGGYGDGSNADLIFQEGSIKNIIVEKIQDVVHKRLAGNT